MTSILLHLRRHAVTALTIVLGACSGPTAEDRALFHLFWVQPQNLAAQTDVPAGIGLAARPTLAITLIEGPERPAREAKFRLVSGRAADTGRAQHHLARADYGRFRAFQERVVASIGPSARVSVRLDIAYCANLSEPAGMGPPVAKVIDVADGTVMMTRPASSTARELQTMLPTC